MLWTEMWQEWLIWESKEKALRQDFAAKSHLQAPLDASNLLNYHVAPF